MATCPSIQAAGFAFCCVLLVFILLFVVVLVNQSRIRGEGLSTANKFKLPVILLLAVPRRLFCFGSLVILDVVCRYLSLFMLNINI